MVLIVAFSAVFGTTICGILRFDLNDFKMVFQKGFEKEMHSFAKDLGKKNWCSFRGGPRNQRVVLARPGDVTTFLVGQACRLG